MREFVRRHLEQRRTPRERSNEILYRVRSVLGAEWRRLAQNWQEDRDTVEAALTRCVAGILRHPERDVGDVALRELIDESFTERNTPNEHRERLLNEIYDELRRRGLLHQFRRNTLLGLRLQNTRHYIDRLLRRASRRRVGSG